MSYCFTVVRSSLYPVRALCIASEKKMNLCMDYLNAQINPHMNIKNTHVFEYAGSARTPIAYWCHMKAMHSLS